MPRITQCNEWVYKGLAETCAAENCMAALMRNSECCGRSPAAKETNFPLWPTANSKMAIKIVYVS